MMGTDRCIDPIKTSGANKTGQYRLRALLAGTSGSSSEDAVLNE
jgi:hypothetical protein